MITVQWRGFTFGGPGSPFGISELSGWLDLPGAQFESSPSTRGHGQSASPGVQGPRLPTISGFLRGAPAQRDNLIAQMQSLMIPKSSMDADTEPLVITAAGRTATAEAQLSNFLIDTDVRVWASGLCRWSARWRCPDPRVFGDEVSVTVPLVVVTAGAKLPQHKPFHKPAKPLGGRAVVNNPGNDPEGSPAVYRLVGPQTGTVGVRNVTTGRVVTYALALAGPDDVNGVPADVLVVDTERGGAFLNGEYRAPTTGSDVTAELRMAPGVNVIQALGTAGVTGSPAITATAKPASW